MANHTNTRVRAPRQDLIGQRFNKLIVKSWVGNSRWKCACDCGGEAIALTANLKRGNTGSCGCIKRIGASLRATKHGLHNTPAYKTWNSIKRRCFEKTNVAYKTYGAKGITMYEDWINDPVAFIEHVGQPPTPDHTLDRIDYRGNYEPGNLRWATPLEQGSNKSNNIRVHYQGQDYTLTQLARKIADECGISHKQMLRAFERARYRKTPYEG